MKVKKKKWDEVTGVQWGDGPRAKEIFSGYNVTMIFSLLEKTQPKGGTDTAAELHL